MIRKDVLCLLFMLVAYLNVFCQVITTPEITSYNPVYKLGGGGSTTIQYSGAYIGKIWEYTDDDDSTNETLILKSAEEDSTYYGSPYSGNLFAIGTVITINFLEVYDTVYIRNDDTGVNGIIGAPGFPITESQELTLRYTSNGWVTWISKFEVSNLSDISTINAKPGDLIEVKNTIPIAKFRVYSSGNSRYTGTAERKTANGYVARVLPIENAFHVNHFGAIPDDSNDDDFFIQEAINFILSTSNGNTLQFGEGVYLVDTGFVLNSTVSKTNRTINGSFESFTIRGVNTAYVEVNSTIIRCTNPNTFIIGAQGQRQTLIENIYLMMADTVTAEVQNDTLKNYTESQLNSYYGARVRNNNNSPNAGIAIDPFSNGGISSGDKYPLHQGSYGVLSGSSMVTIRGVSFKGMLKAITVNPSAVAGNGDNIRVENCHVREVGVFWNTRSSQSRQNSIDNVYGLFVGTYIENNGNGTPPSIRNINGAGYTRKIFDVSTGFGPIRMDNCYFESLGSFGRMGTPQATFNQCQFKFFLESDVPVHGIVGWGGATTTFNDCAIQFFFNGQQPIPLVFDTEGLLTFNRCYLETGIIFNSNTADGLFSNVRIYDSELFAPFNNSSNNRQFISDDYFKLDNQTQNRYILSGSWSYAQNSWTYSGSRKFPFKYAAGEGNRSGSKVTINVNGSDHVAYKITVADGGTYKVNDNIISDLNYTTALGVSAQDMHMGRIIQVTNDTIWCGFLPVNSPNSFSGVKINVYEPYIYTKTFWGDLTAGNDTIKNCYGFLPTTTGIRYTGNAGNLPIGAYVVSYGSDWVKMSAAPVSSTSEVQFSNEDGSSTTGSSSPGTGYVQVGSTWNRNTGGIAYLKCTKGGVFGSGTNEPEWTDTLWYNRIESLPNFVSNTVTGATTNVDLNSNLLTYVYLELSSAPGTVTMNVTEVAPGAEIRVTCANPPGSVTINFSFEDSDGTSRTSFESNSTTAKDVNISFVNINPVPGSAVWVTNDL